MTVTIVKGVTADDSVGAASITGTVAVANGGTGATTLTGILLGNGTSAVTALTTSAGIAGAISDETGSGALVFANTPTLISPLLGTPTSGVMTNVTGTAAGLTAGTVTTNANLTGPITSVGNATSIASQTGTGTTFVVDNTPTLIAPLLGTPTSGVMTNVTGTAAGLTAGNATLAATATVATNLFNTVAATITDSTGRITYPAQPAFSATQSSSSNVTGDGTIYIPGFNSVNYDIGSNFNSTNGRYTAPIAGKYLFAVVLTISNLDVSHTSFTSTLAKNGSALLLSFQNSGFVCSTGGFITVSYSSILLLAANDFIAIRIAVSGGGKTVGINSQNAFTGRLIG